MPVPLVHYSSPATYHILLLLSGEFRTMQQWKSFWLEFLLVPQLRAKCNAQLATGNVQRATCSQIAFATICIEKLNASATIRGQCQRERERRSEREGEQFMPEEKLK